MWRFVFGIVIVLHGLVHLLYFGQSRRLFELRPGMIWPDGSWAFARLLGVAGTRWLASVACLLATAGFVAGGAGLLLDQAWWGPVAGGTAAFSSILYVLFWDGKRQKLSDQGAIAILINIAILVAVLVSSR
jgi:hypothetical protein